MAISKDKALCFRKGGTTYTYYGYTTPPSGHYIGFRSGGVTRYVPLANNTNGELKVRIANSTHSVTKQASTITASFYVGKRKVGLTNYVKVRSFEFLATEGFTENATIGITTTTTIGYALSYVLQAGSTHIPEDTSGVIQPLNSSLNLKITITVFGQTFEVTYSVSTSSTGAKTVPITVTI